MDFLNKIREFFGRGETPPEQADPFDMPHHVRAAYAPLADANKKAIQIPADVVDVITKARAAPKASFLTIWRLAFECSYGLLSSSIQPAATRAEPLSQHLLPHAGGIAVCAVLFSQRIRSHQTCRNRQADRGYSRQSRGTIRRRVRKCVCGSRCPNQAVEDAKEAYLFLSRNLLDIVGTIADLPLRPFGFHSFFSSNASDAGGIIIRASSICCLSSCPAFFLLCCTACSAPAHSCFASCPMRSTS